MTVFRALLMVLFVGLTAYTIPVVVRDGLNFFPAFNGDLRAWHWPGQFNADFLTFLILAALWTAWRNAFSPTGLGLAVCAFFLGGGFVSGYMLYLSLRHRGDIVAMLIGTQRRVRA